MDQQLSAAIERVTQEKTELESQIRKLNAFLKTEKFKEISKAEQVLLRRQIIQMNSYSLTLEKRLVLMNERLKA